MNSKISKKTEHHVIRIRKKINGTAAKPRLICFQKQYRNLCTVDR